MLACLALAAAVGTKGAPAANDLQQGTPDLKSAGSLAFAPDGVLLVGDSRGAAVFAIQTDDATGEAKKATYNVEGLNEKVAAALGASPQTVQINDLAINPQSGNLYLSVSRGRGPDAAPVLLKVDPAGKISELSLKNVAYAKAELPNAPSATATDRRNQPLRLQTITDIGYVDGRVYVAGLSNEEFASKLRSIPYPFGEADKGTSVEIFHGAHGRFETQSPVRTFTSYAIDGEAHLVAAYTCTPLVKFPVSQLKPGEKLQGTTVAELGNRNSPLDMVVYQKNGEDFILMANNNRGVMKIPTKGIDKVEGIKERIDGKAGLTYETIESLQGVTQLDRLNGERAVILVQAENGQQNLKTIELPYELFPPLPPGVGRGLSLPLPLGVGRGEGAQPLNSFADSPSP
jgi:hypothetical protein